MLVEKISACDKEGNLSVRERERERERENISLRD